MDRRSFLKYTGSASGTLALAGISSAGYFAGAGKDSHTGFGRTPYGKDQFFNRKPFLVEKPTYQVVDSPQRIQYIEHLFRRNGEMRRYIHSSGKTPQEVRKQGIKPLPKLLQDYYKNNPGAFDEFFMAMEEGRKQRANWEKYKKKYMLADAWAAAHSSTMRGANSFPSEPGVLPGNRISRELTQKLSSSNHQLMVRS